MMGPWQAIIEEDPYGRVFIFLQKGEDWESRELFDTKLNEDVEDMGFNRPIGQQMADARHEAARRNANEEPAAIARKIGK